MSKLIIFVFSLLCFFTSAIFGAVELPDHDIPTRRLFLRYATDAFVPENNTFDARLRCSGHGRVRVVFKDTTEFQILQNFTFPGIGISQNQSICGFPKNDTSILIISAVDSVFPSNLTVFLKASVFNDSDDAADYLYSNFTSVIDDVLYKAFPEGATNQTLLNEVIQASSDSNLVLEKRDLWGVLGKAVAKVGIKFAAKQAIAAPVNGVPVAGQVVYVGVTIWNIVDTIFTVKDVIEEISNKPESPEVVVIHTKPENVMIPTTTSIAVMQNKTPYIPIPTTTPMLVTIPINQPDAVKPQLPNNPQQQPNQNPQQQPNQIAPINPQQQADQSNQISNQVPTQNAVTSNPEPTPADGGSCNDKPKDLPADGEAQAPAPAPSSYCTVKCVNCGWKDDGGNANWTVGSQQLNFDYSSGSSSFAGALKIECTPPTKDTKLSDVKIVEQKLLDWKKTGAGACNLGGNLATFFLKVDLKVTFQYIGKGEAMIYFQSVQTTNVDAYRSGKATLDFAITGIQLKMPFLRLEGGLSFDGGYAIENYGKVGALFKPAFNLEAIAPSAAVVQNIPLSSLPGGTAHALNRRTEDRIALEDERRVIEKVITTYITRQDRKHRRQASSIATVPINASNRGASVYNSDCVKLAYAKGTVTAQAYASAIFLQQWEYDLINTSILAFSAGLTSYCPLNDLTTTAATGTKTTTEVPQTSSSVSGTTHSSASTSGSTTDLSTSKTDAASTEFMLTAESSVSTITSTFSSYSLMPVYASAPRLTTV